MLGGDRQSTDMGHKEQQRVQREPHNDFARGSLQAHWPQDEYFNYPANLRLRANSFSSTV
jgi:hypothetical protein